MAVALLDTNVLFASTSARDTYHDRAREIVRGIDHGDLPEAIVTNYVIAETVNYPTLLPRCYAPRSLRVGL